MSDVDKHERHVRQVVGDTLQDVVSREKIELIIDTALAAQKQARGWCPNCNKAVMVTIDDSKAAVAALKDLASEAWGKPQEAATEEAGITFIRQIVREEPPPAAA